MNSSTLNLDLILVPARVLERVVALKMPMSVLSRYESLQGILTTEDLYFYKHVNTNIEKFVDKPVVQSFHTGISHVGNKLFEQIDDVSTNMYMTTLTSSEAEIRDLLSRCEKTELLQSSTVDGNKYVGQYFAIDERTVGVVLTVDDLTIATLYPSVRNLLSLLTSDYLNDLDNLSIFRNKNTAVRALSESGLLAYYCSILNHR